MSLSGFNSYTATLSGLNNDNSGATTFDSLTVNNTTTLNGAVAINNDTTFGTIPSAIQTNSGLTLTSFTGPAISLTTITFQPLYTSYVNIAIPIGYQWNIPSGYISSAFTIYTAYITITIYKNGSLVNTLTYNTGFPISKTVTTNASGSILQAIQFITSINVIFTPTFENATNIYEVKGQLAGFTLNSGDPTGKATVQFNTTTSSQVLQAGAGTFNNSPGTGYVTPAITFIQYKFGYNISNVGSLSCNSYISQKPIAFRTLYTGAIGIGGGIPVSYYNNIVFQNQPVVGTYGYITTATGSFQAGTFIAPLTGLYTFYLNIRTGDGVADCYVYPQINTAGSNTSPWNGNIVCLASDGSGYPRRSIATSMLIQLQQGQGFYYTYNGGGVYFCDFSGKFEGTY